MISSSSPLFFLLLDLNATVAFMVICRWFFKPLPGSALTFCLCFTTMQLKVPNASSPLLCRSSGSGLGQSIAVIFVGQCEMFVFESSRPERRKYCPQ